MLIPAVQSTQPVITRYRVPLHTLPSGLVGFTILQISDLHSQRFRLAAERGRGSESHRTDAGLTPLINGLEFDLVALTGDLINGSSSRYYDAPAHEIVDAVEDRAPVYYVTGNHEWSAPYGEMLLERLHDRGVRVLRNQAELLHRDGATLAVVGMDDITYFDRDPAAFNDALTRALLPAHGADFTLLLSHRPELFATYRRHGIDLALSGHAHGGQVRLPCVGGLFAPGQGPLPPYDAGVFHAGRTTMIVSRGLGRTAFPWRINNPPEIVLVELTRELERDEGGHADAV